MKATLIFRTIRPSRFLFRELTVEQKYKMLSPVEHILERPDMYVGSNSLRKESWWLYNDVTKEMHRQALFVNPAFYKIFDEILVNAADNKVRDREQQTFIKVYVNEKTGKIRIINDGVGIPVEIHKVHKIWIPEMIFGHLMTSSNYDDHKDQITGGRYGLGAKLTNVLSRSFEVKTLDKKNRKMFTMKWSQNMMTKCEPLVEDVPDATAGFTEIGFIPDYKYLCMNKGLVKDDVNLLKRRTIDLAGVLGKNTAIYFNDVRIDINSLEEYASLFPHLEKPFIAYKSERWEVIGACVRSDRVQISFVNAIYTQQGGTHVEYVKGLLARRLKALHIEGTGEDIQSSILLSHISLFVNSLISNPSFESQTKKSLKVRPEDFGSFPDLEQFSLDFYNKTLIKAHLSKYTGRKKALEREKPKSPEEKIQEIKGFTDAELAGTDQSHECTLILTEGLSAKGFGEIGRSVMGRDRFGVYALTGKLVNPREVELRLLLSNDVALNLFRILGLSIRLAKTGSGKVPIVTPISSSSGLRYGKILIIADQDDDGSHIAGLIMNFFHVLLPHLIHKPGFLSIFRTPLVKATIDGAKQSFYSQQAFQRAAELGRVSHVKYYKGIGTNSDEEAKSYFLDYSKHIIQLHYDAHRDDKIMKTFFSRDWSYIGKRRRLVNNPPLEFSPDTTATYTELGAPCLTETFTDSETTCLAATYSDFGETCLAAYARAVCMRVIPNISDGQIESQRKTLWTLLNGNFKTSIKVSQLGGYVAERMNYVHGQDGLSHTIIRMAQDFIGSNNIPLLCPEGQFGSRLQNGKDAASDRYIYTRLNPIARLIFRPEDDSVLSFTASESIKAEPDNLFPVIPLGLINGHRGIAVGYHAVTLNHCPLQIIAILRAKLGGEEYTRTLVPHWDGFKGRVTAIGSNTFASHGTVQFINTTTLLITEIPVGTSFVEYVKHLDDLVTQKIIFSHKQRHHRDTFHFCVRIHPQILALCVRTGCLERVFRLRNVHSSNYTFMDGTKVVKFPHAMAALDSFYKKRLDFLGKRKAHRLQDLDAKITKLGEQVKLTQVLVQNPTDLTDRDALRNLFAKHKFTPDNDYHHLFTVPIGTLTKGGLQKRKLTLRNLVDTRQSLEALTVEQEWMAELKELKQALPKRRKSPVIPLPEIEPLRIRSVCENALEAIRNRILSVYLDKMVEANVEMESEVPETTTVSVLEETTVKAS